MVKLNLNGGLASYKRQIPKKGEAESEEEKTVVKPVSAGAVPIIPPSAVIQLQPIVVPIAVVPFETHDTKMLHDAQKQGFIPATLDDNAPKGGSENTEETVYVALDKKKDSIKSIVSLIFTVLYIIPFIIAYFKSDLIPSLPLNDINAIGKLVQLFGGGLTLSGEIPSIMLIVSLLLSLVCLIMSLFSAIIGRYSKIGTLTLAVFPALIAIGVIAYAYIPALGFAGNKTAFFIPAAIGALHTTFAVIFAINSYPKFK